MSRLGCNTIDQALWDVQYCLERKHGTRDGADYAAPLKWYVNTGRASCDFLRAMINAKPYMIARRLSLGGSYMDAIDRVKRYLKQ